MKAILGIAIFGIAVLTVTGNAQDKKKEPTKGEITKAMFWVPNQH